MTSSIAKTVASVLQLWTHQTDGRPQIQKQSKYGNYFSRMTIKMIVFFSFTYIQSQFLVFVHMHAACLQGTYELMHACEHMCANALVLTPWMMIHSHCKRQVGNDSNITKNYHCLPPELCPATAITVRTNHPCNHTGVGLEWHAEIITSGWGSIEETII